ncbi:ABATE domain-containing protein [Streptomyces sp. TG1A-8]|uniref:CGNR zinc finger domain-containing protein n=1 Tax=Streptomyces sp. TG1A-8 TaxID=3051385 RepID=UPI00265C34E8|nr:ABATE domain-containing protein [Streptomyces sp. TG1A-8]MDO0928427.1 ABATE domain-containing protein [Streptomyces sp. TG1A-8]
MASDTTRSAPTGGAADTTPSAKPHRTPSAPSAAADAVLAFANTHADAGGRQERFADAEGLARWLTDNGLPDAAADVSEADAAAVRELRDALVTVLLGHSADPRTSEQALTRAEHLLRRAAARYPLAAVLDRYGARLVPGHDGLPGVLAGILASAAELALTGAWQRLKACRNPPCHFAFYDRSRNTSGAYCTTTCSSQVAMRNYRNRHRAGAATPGNAGDAAPEATPRQ